MFLHVLVRDTYDIIIRKLEAKNKGHANITRGDNKKIFIFILG